MNGLHLRSSVWALGVLAVLTGCATRPIVPDVDTSALLAEPRPGVEPVIVLAPQAYALRAPRTFDVEPTPIAAPAPCALPPGDAHYTSAIRAPVRASAPHDNLRTLFNTRSASAADCIGST